MDESTKKRAGIKSVLKLYARQVLKEPGLFALVVIGMIMLQGANLAAPLFLRQFFNTLYRASPSEQTAHALLLILGLVGVMWLIEWVARRVQGIGTMFLESRVMERLSAEAFDYLLGHSHNFFISNFAGSLTHRVTKYSRAFEALFDSVIIQFIPTFFFVSGVVVILYLRHPSLGIALGIWVVLFLAFQVWASQKRQPLREARSEADTRVTGALADAIGNHTTVMLFSGRTHERQLFAKVISAWQKANIRSWLSDDWIWSGIGLFILVIEVGLIGATVLLWKQGLAEVGDFVLIQAYLMVVFDRLVTINRELRRFYDGLADAGEMAYILELPHEVSDIAGAKPLTVTKGTITFREVDFHFHANRPILARFKLTIDGGEKIALVGPSGAGKSTITKLLLRFHDVTGGVIEIDGQNMAEVTQESLREYISYVPQEPVLFHRTLRENIRYGKRDATDEEIIEAAKKAHCHEFIASLPQGYDTYVGERGVRLSGGERQRVAIARAILKNAPILLLDEATSSLDSESEALIQDALEVLMRGKTVIVIAHRLSTILKMDKIVVLENGIIVAQGTHTELLAQEGLYKKLWNIQVGGFIGEDETTEGEDTPERDELAKDTVSD